ncbi:S-layer homology domain-containing protein [Candidatus Gracilibacteria bacterium]|nr:S-layer homology domain-containing protein [Candidatus Gracilibacteria bacterium]
MKKISLFLCLLFIHPVSAYFSDEEQIPKWATFSIKKLVERNIISGNADGTFRPDNEINRAEFCKILVTATNAQKYIPLNSSFSDIETDDWFFSYTETAKYHGWLSGYPDGTFRPGSKINRAETAKILSNAFGFNSSEEDTDKNWYDKFTRVLKNKSLFPYNTDDDSFTPNHHPSRSEIVEQIFRFMKKTGKFSSYELKDTLSSIDTDETNIPEKETTQTTETFIYTEENSDSPVPQMAQNPGTLNIAKISGGLKIIPVSSAQQEVSALKLSFKADKNPVKISELQIRRIGNGLYSDFLYAWVEIDGTMVSQKILIDNDIIKIPFDEIYTIKVGEKKEIHFKINLSGKGIKGNSSRFVLYLPEWISANTDKKVGFFPFGGVDLEIRN